MLTKEQYELYNFMSELCQKALNKKWCFEWEFSLWEALGNDFKSLEKYHFNDDDKLKLNQLISNCNGWIECRNGEKVFVDLDVWKLKTKRKNTFEILLPIGIFGLMFFILFIKYHIKENTFYFIYPKLTQFFTYLTLIMSLIGILVIAIKNKGLRKFKKLNTGKLVLHVFSIILFVSLFFGSLQYLIYIANNETFQIDNDLLKSQTKKEINKIKEIIKTFKNEKDFLISLKNKIDSSDIYQLEKIQEYKFFGLLKNKEAQLYKFNIDSYILWVKNDLKSKPPNPKRLSHSETNYIRFLRIKKELDEYIIHKDTVTVNYFVNIFSNPISVSAFNLLNIIDNQLLKISIRIKYLEDNIKLINERGIPLSLFSYDTFMKSIHFDQNYYKPVTWIGRILYFIQIIISLFFLLPLISRSIEKYWKKSD